MSPTFPCTFERHTKCSLGHDGTMTRPLDRHDRGNRHEDQRQLDDALGRFFSLDSGGTR
jgi:hypothetical protein